MLALVFGVALPQIQRFGYELTFRAITGGSLHIASLHHDAGALVLDGVRIDAASGDAKFTAQSVRVTRKGDETQVAIEGPSGSIVLGRDTLRRMRSLRGGVGMFVSRNVSASVSNGSLTLARSGSSAPPLRIDAFNGTVATANDTLFLDGTAAATDGAQAYPLTFSAGHIHAAKLPLAPVWALLPPSSIAFTAGLLHDVDLELDLGTSGSFGLREADGSYQDHKLHGVHGMVVFSADGVATRNLSGFIDDIPVQIAGEVHDVRNWNRALREGTKNLRAVARVYDMISPTANLRWIKLEANAPGVAFGQYAMRLDEQPRVVQLVTIDPHEKSLHFDTALSGDHLISKGERTSDMAIRTHAIAGLNGDYFDIARTYQPQGMFIKSGRLLRGPTDRQSLIIDRNNNVYFDEFKLRGTLRIGEREFPVTQYNNWPLGYVTVITPDFGRELPPAPGARFLALAYVRRNTYRVVDVSTDSVPSPLRFGVALGAAVKLKTLPARGSLIHLDYHIAPLVPGAVAGIGGGPLLLRNGKWFEDPHAPAPDERDVRWPVDALGVLPDKTLIMVAVDGRHPERSVGMTRPEFGKLLQDFGVTDAMALDSGGSVTLVARSPGDVEATLHNMPSDDSAERYVSNGIFLYSSAPIGSLLQSKATATAAASTPN